MQGPFKMLRYWEKIGAYKSRYLLAHAQLELLSAVGSRHLAGLVI